MLRKSIHVFFILLVFLVFAEIFVRLYGVHPFQHFDRQSSNAIEETFSGYFCSDENIGVIPCPDTERTMLQAGKIPFRATHLSDGSRYCGKSSNIDRKLLLTGDSNIHGDGVDDDEHIGYVLQEKLDSFKVINRAIPGSGAISQLLVLQETLKEYVPELVVATYASFHNERNIMARSSRKNYIVPESKRQLYKFPKGRITNDQLVIDLIPYQYTPTPFSDISAFAEFLNLILEKTEYIYKKGDQVTLKIWEDYIKICKENNVKLLVLLIASDQNTENFISFLKEKNVEFLPLHLSQEMTLFPVDGHPNAYGHFYMAETIVSKIAEMYR